MDRDNLSAEAEQALIDAYRKAQERLAAGGDPAEAPSTTAEDQAETPDASSQADSAAPAPPAVPDVQVKAETAGTFSSMNLGQMFGGSSAAERTARATEQMAQNMTEMMASTAMSMVMM